MKLKTLKELGINDAEITIYEKVKKIRKDRNMKDFAINNFSTPLFLFIFFVSSALSTIINIWMLININNKYGFIKDISFNDAWFLIGIIFLISMLSSAIFIFGLLCLAINNLYAKKQKEIEKEIYNNEG